MPRAAVFVRPDTIPADVLSRAAGSIAAEFELPAQFAPEVVADAVQQAAHPDLSGHADRTDVGFVTIDPPGSKDLDQAMHLSRHDGGFRVRYAIADVAAFVRPGSPVDIEARRRGQTVYTPDGRYPLHPPELSEGAASLLPDQVAPAFVWTIDVDDQGRTVAAGVERAMVRSRARLDYEGVQAGFDAGDPPAAVALLGELGPLLQHAEQARGGAALNIPDQEVVPSTRQPGTYELRYRPVRPVEDWNAQISLLTGRAAADMMVAARVGILRTMPEPDDKALDTFRLRAAALHRPWPNDVSRGDFLRSLDPAKPNELALLHASARLFRGAGYTAFDGSVPEHLTQAAVADEYAHVTAPLRRLVDRFGLVVCEAVSRGAMVPDWVREALPTLPDVIAASDRRAGAVDRTGIDLAEALLLSGREGDTFDAVVVSIPDKVASDGRYTGSVQLTSPAVLATAAGTAALRPGTRVTVRLDEVDVVERRVEFSVVASA